MATKVMRCIQRAPVKPGPEGGTTFGWVWAGTVLVFEFSSESPHDGWGHIVGPNPPINADGTYLKSGKQAWCEMTHFSEVSETKTTIAVEVDWDNRSWTVREI